MDIKIRTKKLLYTLLLNASLFSGTTLCMERVTTIIQEEDSRLDNLRKGLETEPNYDKLFELDPSIKILENIPPGTRYGVCHNYVFSKLMNKLGSIPEELAIVGCGDWFIEYNILEHFTPVKNPQKEDLVVYRADKNDSFYKTQHVGLVYEDGYVESKWGTHNFVLAHLTFNVPISYGKAISYFRPLITGDELFNAIKDKVDMHKEYLNKCQLLYKIKLLTIASDPLVNDTEKASQAYAILESTMFLRVDITNECNQTPLMLAALTGNIYLAELLINYHQNINAQDNDGNTPFLLAIKNHHYAIARLLTAKGCDTTIKDKFGKRSHDYLMKRQPYSFLNYLINKCRQKRYQTIPQLEKRKMDINFINIPNNEQHIVTACHTDSQEEYQQLDE